MRKSVISFSLFLMILTLLLGTNPVFARTRENKDEKRKEEIEQLQEKFQWWPTDAKPGPVKDLERGGYWWWPDKPGEVRPWGNRGYIYVYKIIFDYKEEELPPPQPKELRPSLLIRKIIKNVKIYFDYDRFDLRDDAISILDKAVGTLHKYPDSEILITGNADVRGSEAYNEKLARHRAESVKDYMLQKGIPEERIKIVSRGKLDAVAPVTDLVGMQKDRNAQFMIADVEEVMIPSPGEPPEINAKPMEEGKYMVEKEEHLEGEVKVSTKEYTIKAGDTLEKIAKEYLGAAYRWKYLYEVNKERIANPRKLQAGTVIIIPIEVEADKIKAEIPTSEAPAGESPSLAEPESKAPPAGFSATMPSEPTTAEVPATVETREYVVKSGDTLGAISLQQLGTSKRWREIYQLNQDRIKDPNRLKAGQTILLPVK